MFLSQVKWVQEARLGFINLINAPMGSGKTRYTAYYPLPSGKKALLVTPLTAALLQAGSKKGKYTITQAAALRHITQNWAFGEPHEYANHERFATTVQSLVRNLKVINWDDIAVLFIDEVDWVFLDLPKWERSATTTKAYQELAELLQEICHKVLVIGLSATGIDETAQNLRERLGAETPIRVCVPSGNLRQLPRDVGYAPTAEYLLLSNPYQPLAVYYPTVNRCAAMKQWAEQRGLRTAVIVSENAKNYTMSESDLEVRRQIEENETVPDWVDVLIFNDTLQRGVNIHHSRIRRVYVEHNEGDSRAETQAHGRFRYAMELFYMRDWQYWWKQYMPRHIQLLVGDKKFWHRAMKFPTWKAWKEALERVGFAVATKKGVVDIKGEELESRVPIAASTMENKITTPMYMDFSRNYITNSPVSYKIFFEEGEIMSVTKKELIGLQPNVGYTLPMLQIYYGFGGVTDFESFASLKGYEVISRRVTVRGYRLSIHVMVAKGEQNPTYITFLDTVGEFNHPQHLREIAEIYNFVGKPFNADEYIALISESVAELKPH